MRRNIARVCIVCAVLMWALVFPLVILRFLVQVPNLYARWIHDTPVYDKLTRVVTILILRHIPADDWSPWIKRQPEVIQNVVKLAVNQHTFERLMPQYLVCWAQWWIGENQDACQGIGVLETEVSAAQWEIIRAYLWETLPTCDLAASPYCQPLNPSDTAAYGIQQSIWWTAYKPEFVTSLKNWESEGITAITQRQARKQAYQVFILLALLFTFSALLSCDNKKRVATLSLLCLSMGGSGLVLGGALSSGLVRFSLVWHVLGLRDFYVLDILMPQVWPMLAYLLGNTLIWISCLILVPVLIGLAVVTSNPVSRTSLIGSICAVLAVVGLIIPRTILLPAEPFPEMQSVSTPTPWPTFTPIPTITPSPTLKSWPVHIGTPIPAVLTVWWEKPQILRCQSLGSIPIMIIKRYHDELWVIQQDRQVRFTFADFNWLAEVMLPRAYDHLSLSTSGNYAALTAGNDIWFYTLPDWIPLINSRISTPAPITAVTISIDETHAILGLQNGQIWIFNIHSGEVATLYAAHQTAVTALANDVDKDRIYSGASDGTVALWQFRTGQEIFPFLGHTAAIQSIIPFTTSLVTLDSAGQIKIWNTQSGHLLRERSLAELPSTDLVGMLGISPLAVNQDDDPQSYIAGGTPTGQVFMLDTALRYQKLFQFDKPIGVLYPVGKDYCVVGMENGLICVIGTPQ